VTVPVAGAVHDTLSLPETAGVARLAVTFFGALSTMALTVADGAFDVDPAPPYSTRNPVFCPLSIRPQSFQQLAPFHFSSKNCSPSKLIVPVPFGSP
jgi:hypothetical protein